MSNDIITPVLSQDDLYKGTGKEFEVTPPGTYRMALAGELKVKTTEKGERKLEAFFKHVESANKAAYNGVNLSVMLEGVDKNGRPKAKQFGDFLQALGISSDDIVGGNASVVTEGSPEKGAEWKGVSAAVIVKGDRIDLFGREAIVKVEANTFNGKTNTRGVAIYKA